MGDSVSYGSGLLVFEEGDQRMTTRKQHKPAFKEKVVLEASKSERRWPSSRAFEAHSTMIHQWKR